MGWSKPGRHFSAVPAVNDVRAPASQEGKAPLMIFLRCALLVLLLAAMSATDARACTCAAFASPQEHIDNTDLIFEGRALSTQTRRGGDVLAGEETAFQVERVWKGDVTGRVAVIHPETVCCICGVAFTPGTTYKIFADMDGAGRFRTSLCNIMPLEAFEWEEYVEVLGERLARKN